MPAKRNSLGMFSKKEQQALTIPKAWSAKAITILILLFLISPWIYLILKKNTLAGVSEKMMDFYERSFSCTCPNNNTEIGEAAWELTKKTKNSI